MTSRGLRRWLRWGIPNPSFTGFVTTQNHGTMELLLDFRPG